MVNSLANRFLDSLYPASCALCDLASHRALPLCAACEGELPRNDSCCVRCALPLPATGASPDRVCGACLQHPPPFRRVIAPWLYSAQMACLVQQWKYQRQWYLTALLSHLWCAGARTHGHIDLVIPVPLHWTRFWYRGANQAALLGADILRRRPATAAALDTSLARRNRATGAQSQTAAGGRRVNLRGAFTVRQPCDNLRIAVVDDVLTTGATAHALCRELLGAGAEHVEVWCLARTPAPRS